MKNYVFEDGEEPAEEVLEDEDATEEDGFKEGFEDDDKEAEECSECGTAISAEKRVVRTIEGEQYVFCSKECADEFEDSLGEAEEES